MFLSEEEKNQNESKNCLEINTDPWPGYRFTGKLRPHYPLVRPARKYFCVRDSIKAKCWCGAVCHIGGIILCYQPECSDLFLHAAGA